MYDLIIIGSGPAGYSASIYASRYKVSNVVLGAVPGGLATKAHMVENWPGIKSITGIELMEQFREHAESLGGELLAQEAVSIKKINEGFQIATKSNKEIIGKTIILALGTEHRKLNIAGEEEFLGKGVSYCTVCDAMFFNGKTVAIVGGSDAACTGAIHLSGIAKKVYIIYRGGSLRGEPVWYDRIKEKDNIEVVYNTNITEIQGDTTVKKIILDNKYNNKYFLDLDGVFIEVGSVPSTSLVTNIGIKLDDKGYIEIDNMQGTNIEGVYAAGDITNGLNKLRQIITACAEGAVAATSVFTYLKKK